MANLLSILAAGVESVKLAHPQHNDRISAGGPGSGRHPSGFTKAPGRQTTSLHSRVSGSLDQMKQALGSPHHTYKKSEGDGKINHEWQFQGSRGTPVSVYDYKAGSKASVGRNPNVSWSIGSALPSGGNEKVRQEAHAADIKEFKDHLAKHGLQSA